MSSVNKAIIIGFLGRDPDIRTAPSGAKAATLSVATAETWRDKATGERKERTQWHRVVVFNEGLVKVVEQYVRKGSKLYLEGSMQTRRWIDKQNVERFVTEVVLGPFGAQLALLDRRDTAPPAATGPDDYASGAGRPADDDEIPF